MKGNEIMGRKRLHCYAFSAVLIGAVMLVLCVWLPFGTATASHKAYLQEYSDGIYAEELNMKNADAVHLSLFEYGRAYYVAAELEQHTSVAIACLVIIIGYGVLALLTLLFAALKKPIPTLVFNYMTFGVFQLIKWDFKDRGVLPSSSYDFGISQYICYGAVAIVTIGALVLLVVKILDRKEAKAEMKGESV